MPDLVTDATISDATISDATISDDELTALAMAADPDTPVGTDDVPWRLDGTTPALLPEWYMPAARAAGGRARRSILVAVAVALVGVNAAGLCVTYGFPEIAW